MTALVQYEEGSSLEDAIHGFADTKSVVKRIEDPFINIAQNIEKIHELKKKNNEIDLTEQKQKLEALRWTLDTDDILRNPHLTIPQDKSPDKILKIINKLLEMVAPPPAKSKANSVSATSGS